MVAQGQRLGYLVQALLADQRRTDAGQVALRQVGVLFIQMLGGDEAQHRVAQKFQPLVAGDVRAAMLVGIGAVVQGRLQQRRVAERIAQLLFQCFHTSVSFEKIRPVRVVFFVSYISQPSLLLR